MCFSLRVVGEYGPYYEGDILTDHRLSKRSTIAQDSPSSGFGDSGVITEHTEPYQPFWPNGKIPYKFEDSPLLRKLPNTVRQSTNLFMFFSLQQQN